MTNMSMGCMALVAEEMTRVRLPCPASAVHSLGPPLLGVLSSQCMSPEHHHAQSDPKLSTP